MTIFQDSYNRFNSGKQHLDNNEYALALDEFQKSIELSIKSLLDFFEIDYQYDHDLTVKDKTWLNRLLKKIESNQIKLPNKSEHYKLELAKALVWMRLLTSIRDFTNYAGKELGVPATNLFDYNFKAFTIAIKDASWRTYCLVSDIVIQIKSKT